MIVKDNLPINLATKKGFNYFCRVAFPQFTVPEQHKIEELLDEKYIALSSVQKSRIHAAQHVSLTTYTCTDSNTHQSYLGLSAHYVDQLTAKVITFTIGVKQLDGTCTTADLKVWLLQTAEEWKIDHGKVVMVLSDDSCDIKNEVEDIFGTDKYHSCFLQNLNFIATAITKSDPDVSLLCSKVETLVGFFENSTIASDLLRKQSEEALVKSCQTKWNSTYSMIERFFKLSSHVAAILITLTDSPPMLDSAEVQLCCEVVRILRPLEEASRELTDSKCITASKIIPMINCLLMSVTNSSVSTEIGKRLKDHIVSELTSKFKNVEFILPLAIATLTDPRFKRLHFRNAQACSNALSHIAQEIRKKEATPTVKDNHRQMLTPTYDWCDLWSYHKQLERDNQVKVDAEDDNLPDELNYFLNEPVSHFKVDPIAFWHDSRNSLYPFLSDIAMKHLCIPAISVPSDGMCLLSNNILESNRSLQQFKQMLFLNDLHFINWQIN